MLREERQTPVPAADWSCQEVFQALPLERADRIKAGVHALWALDVVKRLPLRSDEWTRILGISPAAVSRRATKGERLSAAVGERLVGMAKIIGQVEVMVMECGDPSGFDAGKWLNGWLQSPIRVLGGARPADHLDTMEGQAEISRLLATMQSGAYV